MERLFGYTDQVTTETQPDPRSEDAVRYRFGTFEADPTTGELRRKGLRVKLHAQPFQVLLLMLRRPGEMLTREEICRELWPEGTFVDYEHGVNSAVNRLRETLGDKASNPRFIETLARRGYRFVAAVERVAVDRVASVGVASSTNPTPVEPITVTGFLGRVLAAPEDLPKSSHRLVRTFFLLLQAMYLGFYIGALANLPEINELMSSLMSALPFATEAFLVLVISAAVLIPLRIFLLCAVLFRAPQMQQKFLRLWWLLLPLDLLWSLAPFLLVHHISYGVALACMTPLVYSPFAQRSLMLMGTGDAPAAML